MHKRRLPDEAYRRAWNWLDRQEDGVRRDRLIYEVILQAANLEGRPAPTVIRSYPTNSLITFERLGLLLSEDQKGLIYAWIPEQSTLSQTWQ